MFGFGKERKYICKGREKLTCGSKHGPKIDKNDEKEGTYIKKQCDSCKKKQTKKQKRTNYKYICYSCWNGHGKLPMSGEYSDKATLKKCEDCTPSYDGPDVSVGL
jgi:hypothetical protein